MKRAVIVVFMLLCILLTSCDRMDVAHGNEKEKVVLAVNLEEEIKEEKDEPKIYTVKMRAVGDIMTHDYQLDVSYDKKNNTYNFDSQFELIKPFLKEADITIGNLESTFGGKEKGYTGYPQFNTPDCLGDSLKNVGFDILSTANNHSMDTYGSGALRTLDILDNLGMEHVGTYRSQEASEQIKIKTVNNISFAFLSYTYGTNGIPIPEEYPYLVSLIDMEKMKTDIEETEKLSPDFIIVSIHFGEEYQKYPNDEQKHIVDELLNAGADIILGTHPHVIQPMETRKIIRADGSEETCFVIYSLGNFISSQRTPLDPPRDAGIILNLDFEKKENEKAKIKTISFMPTWVQFSTVKARGIIRVIGNNIPDEELKYYLNPQEINRFKNTKEYTIYHLLGEDEQRIEENFYIYPYD